MRTICYAYYGDNKFLGWHADSFGSIRENSPKLYRNSKEQNEIISKSFKYKIAKIKEKSNISSRNASLIGLKIIDESINKDAFNLSQYKQIELRSVECPYYDGPNSDDNAKWIYADYTLVKEWASKEPTEFINIIKS